jgi:hypothetical protein
MAKYSGSGWHFQSVRHSNARKYGKAGGTYAKYSIPHPPKRISFDDFYTKAQERWETKGNATQLDERKVKEEYDKIYGKKHFGEAEPVITKSELTGNSLKKLLGAKKVMYRWHNKNNTGGNFGINIYFADEFNRETDREITGAYDTEGKIRYLNYGELYSAGIRLPPFAFKTIPNLIKYIKWHEAWHKGERESPPVTEEEFNR